MLQVALLALLAVAPDPTSAVGRGVAPASRAGHLLAAKRATPERRPASPDAPPAQASRGDKLVGEWPARPSGKTVALEEEPTLDEALGKIAEAAGWNLVANTGAAGDRKLVVAVRGAPVEEALQAVLEGSPLVATRRGNTVTVAAAPAPPPRERPVLSGFDGRPTGKRFTGDFAEVPVGQALGKVCDAAGLSVVFAPDVRGTVDGHFRNAPVEDVLRESPWLDNKPRPPLPATAPTGQAYRERIAAAAQASLSMTPRPAYTAPSPAAGNVNNRETAPLVPADPAPTGTVSVREPLEPFRPEPASGYFSALTVIGQFHGEYILCQSGTELVIIDQHAASERVAYQRLKQQCLGGAVESQHLLFPETVELSFSEVAVAGRFHDDLVRIGFELEPFGGNTLIITAVPRLIGEQDAIRLVRDILADLSQLGTSAAFQDMLDGLLSRIACHSVVRGVHPLETRQISELLRSMDDTDFAASCPHGRPVSHVITHAELEKIFKRT